MEILLYVNGALLLTLCAFVIKLSYAAGQLSQTVSYHSDEIQRLRNCLDQFLYPYKHHDSDKGC